MIDSRPSPVQVTVVLQKLPKNPPPGESLVSATIPSVKNSWPVRTGLAVRTTVTTTTRTYSYALLSRKNPAGLETALRELSAQRYENLTLESRDAGYRFYAQALTDMSPEPELLSNGMGSAMPMVLIWGLIGFVVLLTVFPCLNYANLCIARALVRAKVGIRKDGDRPRSCRQF